MKTQDRRIFIVPQGGLANRMRAIASALVHARHLSIPLTVVWHRNSMLNASYNLIFDTASLPFELIEDNSPGYHIFYEEPRKKNLFTSLIFSKLKGNTFLKNVHLLDDETLWKSIVTCRGNVIINSGHEFATINHELISSVFKFSAKVKNNAKKILGKESPDYALQIRRTDNRESILHSPLDLFEDVVDRRIGTNPTAKFFLATDDSDVKKHFSQKYPDNIIFNPNMARRDIPEGIIDGASEMAIMAQCKVIYGSYYSSYSEMASLLGNNTLNTLTRESNPS